MMLTNRDITELADWRQMLHRFPEVSGAEVETARRVCEALAHLAPDEVVTGLGGQGVAAVWHGAEPGETVMFRAELDALPIEEISAAAHRSTIPGKAHLCGHEGHMTLLMGLGRLISRQIPARGRVVLMFQPAEEDGSGAAAVVADPGYAAIAPDWAFAIHNMPGVPLGHAVLQAGTVNCASRGVKITLSGKTSHASEPQMGLSPGLALAELLAVFTRLAPPAALAPGYRLITVTHARLGEPAFGISPGVAELWLTLRTMADAEMAALQGEVVALAGLAAETHGLAVAFGSHDDFAASVNHPEATLRIAAAVDAVGLPREPGDLPMRASEDFGRFGQPGTRSAMLFLGAGHAHAALHNPDYDFPDDLIPIGVRVFHRIMTDILG